MQAYPSQGQTFGLSLLRKVITTGQRGMTHSKHNDVHWKRCNQMEDDIHLFFSFQYAKVAFVSILCLRVDGLLQQGCTTIPDTIDQFLRTCYQERTLEFILTVLWMVWKYINNPSIQILCGSYMERMHF